MAAAVDYSTWFEAAQELDRLQGLEAWKEDDVSEDYDYRLIRSRLRQIRHYRREGDDIGLVHHLRQGLHWNLGNIGNPVLYHNSYVGTKYLITEYVNELVGALDYLCDGTVSNFDIDEKIEFFEHTAQSFGRSALMLSGGATLGIFHLGVVKALWEQGLLPRTLSGSSAGAIVAATLGSHTDEEIQALIDNHSGLEYVFWKLLHPIDMLRRRVLMDQHVLRRSIADNIPDLTFEHAYGQTSRAVNITVSPTATNQIPRLLNHLTFPQLYLHEAVLASCAVPVLFQPVRLATRDTNGRRKPFMPSLSWVDGAIRGDLPTLRLRRLFNVNHTVVSQTNPHVLPFLNKRPPGHGGLWESTRDYLMSNLKYQSKFALNMVRRRMPLGSVRRPLRTLHSVLDQDYRGDVTILPDYELGEYLRMATNPGPQQVRALVLAGERATWPRLAMIHNQTRVSQAFDRCLRRLEQRKAKIAPVAGVTAPKAGNGSAG